MRIIAMGNGQPMLNYMERLRNESIPFVSKSIDRCYRSSKSEIKLLHDIVEEIPMTYCTERLLVRDRDLAIAQLLATNIKFKIVA